LIHLFFFIFLVNPIKGLLSQCGQWDMKQI
jgi:hypothetical protein